MFDKATRTKLRFQTDRGQLCVEDVWDLNLTALNALAKSLNRKLKQDQEEDFLSTKNEADATDKLRFDIVVAILEVKKAEKVEKEQSADKKAKREMILGVLAQKQNEAIQGKSVEELMKELEALGG
jgi:hypothetical protein